MNLLFWLLLTVILPFVRSLLHIDMYANILLEEIPIVVYTRATENLDSSTEDVGYWDNSRYVITAVYADLSEILEDGLLRIVPEFGSLTLQPHLPLCYCSLPPHCILTILLAIALSTTLAW